MIYSKSSADYAAKYDLKRCFKSGFLFPFFACVIFLFVLLGTLSSSFQDEDYIYRIFRNDMYEWYTLLQYIYAAFGALTGLASFSFLASVKKSNVYLSMGISRKQLVKNRIISSTVYIALASVLPFILAIILNHIYLTVESGLIKACGFYALVYFGDMLLGFAVASILTIITGNIIESGVWSATALLTPTAIVYLMGDTINNFVNGVAFSNYDMYYEFGGFCRTFASYVRRLNPLEYLSSAPRVGFRYKEGEPYSLSGFDYLTAVMWLIVAIVLVLFVVKAIEKRKAEIAGSLGANKNAVRFACTVYAFISFMLVSNFASYSKALGMILCVIIPAFIFIGMMTLVYRSKAEFISSLKDGAVTATGMLCITVILATGIFGYFKKLPTADEIEYAGICPSSVEYILSNNDYLRTTRDSTKVYGPMTDNEDIRTILSIHQKVVDGLDKGDDSVCFVYKMKNGKVIARSYRSVSLEGAKASLGVVNTKWYDNLIRDSFTDWDFDYSQEFKKIPAVTKTSTKIEETEIGLQYDYLSYKELYNSGDIYIYGKTLNRSVKLSDKVSREEEREFRKVFSQELIDLSPDEIFYPEEQALFHIRIKMSESEDYYDANMKNIPVYATMKKTVDFLKRHKISFDNLTADDVVEMRLLSPGAGVVSVGVRSEKSTAVSYLSAKYLDKNFITRDDDAFRRDDAFSQQESITDRKLIEKYFNTYKSYYSYSGDNGKFVQFIFKDQSDLVAYISEKNL